MSANVFSVSADLAIGFLGFLIQLGATIGAIAIWGGRLSVRVSNLEGQMAQHSDLALAVEKLKTTMERAVNDIDALLSRANIPTVASPLAGLPPEMIAKMFIAMAQGK